MRITMKNAHVGATHGVLPEITMLKNYVGTTKEQIEWHIRYEAEKYGFLRVEALTPEEIKQLEEKHESNSQVSESGKSRKQRSTKKNSTKHGV